MKSQPPLNFLCLAAKWQDRVRFAAARNSCFVSKHSFGDSVDWNTEKLKTKDNPPPQTFAFQVCRVVDIEGRFQKDCTVQFVKEFVGHNTKPHIINQFSQRYEEYTVLYIKVSESLCCLVNN